MNKIDGVPFHGTPPSQKHVGNTSSVMPSSSKSALLNTFKQAAIRAAVGYASKKAIGLAASYVGIHPALAEGVTRAVQREPRTAQFYMNRYNMPQLVPFSDSVGTPAQIAAARARLRR